MKNLLWIWVMLARRLEKPRNTGERSKILVKKTKFENEFMPLSPMAKRGKSNFIKYGAVMKAMEQTTAMNAKKNEKTLSMNFLAFSSLFSNASMRNGMRTEIETMEATVTNNM